MKKPALVLFLLAIAFSVPAPEGRVEPYRPEAGSDESTKIAPSDRARALFGLGVLIGRVEQGTADGAEPESLVFHLLKIQELAVAFGTEDQFSGEIDTLIEAMESTEESRDLHGQIVKFRRNLTTLIAGLNLSETENPEGDSVPFDCDIGSWEGVWETSYGDMTLVFDEEGGFHGTYGTSQHAVSGKFDPDNPKVLRGRWDHFGSVALGGIRFEMKAPNRFEGGWSGEIPGVGMGSGWSGTRRRTHHSEILIVPIGEATVGDLPETKVPIWSQSFLIKKGFSVHGKNVDFPFIQIYTLASETGEWEKWGPLHDTTETGLDEIPAGRSFVVDILLPEELARRQFVVEFGREAVVDDEEHDITLRTRPLRLVPPKTKGTEPDFHPDGEETIDGEGAPTPDGVEASPGKVKEPPVELNLESADDF